MKFTYSALLLALLSAVSALAANAAQVAEAAANDHIVIGQNAPAMEQYAARELQRYIYQVSGSLLAIETAPPGGGPSGRVLLLGTRDSNPLIAKLAGEGQVQISATDPGPQGYVLKNYGETLVIAGSDEVGCLYGVYGLLEDYYGIGFYLGGDVLPDQKTPLKLPDVDERKKPAVAIRGLLPWTNFPQSATSYSWQDWKFIIDQMSKMRMNLLHIHNYLGWFDTSEMFHNFEVNGVMPRAGFATAASGHKWGGEPGWQVGRYLFGATDLFDDYDFGAACALHNERLDNRQVFRKGASMFQKVIAYAHHRGVKVALGVEFGIIPKDCKELKADDPQVIAARVRQITTDYPDLDYLICYQVENFEETSVQAWRKTFDQVHAQMKQQSTGTRIAASGWGLTAQQVASLPPDVICAPISPYSASCENGAIYGDREYWGCPWLERDGGSSEYYYPYNMNLSETIQAWQNRAPNLKGFYSLTWRLTDAIDPKMSYIAKVPWYDAGKYDSSAKVYREYAERSYGTAAAAAITEIINQNEPLASDFGECGTTPPFAESTIGGTSLFNIATFSVHPKDAKGEPLVAAQSAQQNGTKNAPCTEGGLCVGFIDHGHWLRFDNVDFGTAADTFEARVASATQGGRIELHLDTLEAPVLGVCTVENTGDWQKWVTRTASIPPTSGKHTLYLKFSVLNTSATEFAKAVEQLKVIDACIAAAPFPAQKARLQLLRCRIAAAKDHIELNQKFNQYTWSDLPGAMESWAQNFMYRVTDISSLGNVVSTQNRFVQLNYVKKENDLRAGLAVQPPSAVTARGTLTGAVISWQGNSAVQGYHVYRDGAETKAGLLPAAATSFTDEANGRFRYTVTAVATNGMESLPSVPVTCEAGPADRTPPHIVMISPPTSTPEDAPVWIDARILDNRSYEAISATLRYRVPGANNWASLPMTRRVKAIFTAQIPASAVRAAGLEYYVEASDGSNIAIFPASAPAVPLSLVACLPETANVPASPGALTANGDTLSWPAIPGAFWYRIYRSHLPNFEPGPDTLLTYVDASTTTSFRDNGLDFSGHKLTGTSYYSVTAVNKDGRESKPAKTIAVAY